MTFKKKEKMNGGKRDTLVIAGVHWHSQVKYYLLQTSRKERRKY